MVLCCRHEAWLWSSRTGSHSWPFGSGHNLGQEGFGRWPFPDRLTQRRRWCLRCWNSHWALPVLVKVINVKVIQVEVEIICTQAVPYRTGSGSCAPSLQGCAGQGLVPVPRSRTFVPATVTGLEAEPEGTSLPALSLGKRQLCSSRAGDLLSTLLWTTRGVQGLICFGRKVAGMNRKHRWEICGFGGVSVRTEAPARARTWTSTRTHTKALLHGRLQASRKSDVYAILVQIDRIGQQFSPGRDDKGRKKEKIYLVTSIDLPSSTTLIKQFCLTAIKHINIWWFHHVLSHHVWKWFQTNLGKREYHQKKLMTKLWHHVYRHKIKEFLKARNRPRQSRT